MKNKLQELVRELMKEKQLTLTELSQGIDYSKATTSEWVNEKYPGDSAKIDALVAAFLRERYPSVEISFRDSLKLTSILALLDESDNREQLLAAVTRFGL